jgi:hypothetical protein
LFRIDLSSSDSYLLLTPQFGGLHPYVQVLILSAIAGLVLFLVYRLYRYELQFVAKRYSALLFALRLAMIVAVLSVVALRPSIRHITHEEIPSHLLIAIDRSDSMNVTDQQRDPIEKLKLARALNLAAGLADDKTLAGWIDRLRNLDAPTEDSYRKILERVDRMPRKAFAERALDSDGASLFKLLGDRHKLEIVGFSQQLGRMPPTLESIRGLLLPEGSKPGEAYTDLKLPLKQGLSLREELKDGLIGVVIFSDGQHNWGHPPGELAYQLGHTDSKPRVPVYTVVCGAKVPPPDLAIVSLKAAPPIVFKNGIAELDLRVAAHNLPEGKIKVTVAYPDAPELPDRKPIVEFIEFDGMNQPPPRTIPVKMERAAAEKLTVSVELLPKDGGTVEDRFPENNTRQVVVTVAPDKAKVLVVDGEARWELHYLQSVLNRDETMETNSVVFGQPRLNLVRDEDLSALNLPALKLPGPDDLARNDCIILGDAAPESLSFEERSRLEKFVADRGGTLVILAGKQAMPLEYLRPGDPIGRMLPITNARALDRTEGFRIALSVEGMQTGFLRLENEAGLNEERWSALPLHYWAVAGKPKPGAAVLAYAPGEGGKTSADAEQTQALIVRQNYGFGRVVYVGLDSTWRWRFKQGDKYHHRFWSQLIRWAASDRALISGNEFVRFGVREPVYRSDQEVEMLVRLGEKAQKLSRGATVSARLLRKTKPGGPEETVALASLKSDPEIPGQFEGAQGNLPPGDYSMELAIRELDDKLIGPDGRKLRSSFKVLPPDSGELLNLATNWETMKEIAEKSGGAMYSVDQVSELLEKLKVRTASREVATDKYLWQSWWMLIPLLVLLTIEWLLRKWVGLT